MLSLKSEEQRGLGEGFLTPPPAPTHIQTHRGRILLPSVPALGSLLFPRRRLVEMPLPASLPGSH